MARSTRIAATMLLACAMVFLVGAVSGEKVYTQTFRSLPFTLGPGDAIDKHLEMEMPKGHVAIRFFNAHVVDEDGVAIPLHEAYLHHWSVYRWYQHKGNGERIRASNLGVCDLNNLSQLFGLGSETRRTDTSIPAPYGIEVGNPDLVPEGYEEVWIINPHAIDTRGVADKRGCTECLCSLYNITDPPGSYGRIVPEHYVGGLECCYDDTHCILEDGFDLPPPRTLYMEYWVKWVDMSDEVVPVKAYIFDVTNTKATADGEPHCATEYTVPKCAEGVSPCIHKAENVNFLPEGKGGDVVYLVAHQHAGGLGSTLYNSDGSEMCTSLPTYGRSMKAGDEIDYVVGMSACYPTPGSLKVRGGDALTIVSWYNNEEQHTGVMGLFYILVDDSATEFQGEPKGQADGYITTIA